jgi:hypothetical protein
VAQGLSSTARKTRPPGGPENGAVFRRTLFEVNSVGRKAALKSRPPGGLENGAASDRRAASSGGRGRRGGGHGCTRPDGNRWADTGTHGVSKWGVLNGSPALSDSYPMPSTSMYSTGASARTRSFAMRPLQRVRQREARFLDATESLEPHKVGCTCSGRRSFCAARRPRAASVPEAPPLRLCTTAREC